MAENTYNNQMANCNDYLQNIASTTVFLERFFDNLIFNGKNELKNRFCHIRWNSEAKTESTGSRDKADNVPQDVPQGLTDTQQKIQKCGHCEVITAGGDEENARN